MAKQKADDNTPYADGETLRQAIEQLALRADDEKSRCVRPLSRIEATFAAREGELNNSLEKYADDDGVVNDLAVSFAEIDEDGEIIKEFEAGEPEVVELCWKVKAMASGKKEANKLLNAWPLLSAADRLKRLAPIRSAADQY